MGELAKLLIIAYKQKTYQDEIARFIVPINPEQYSQLFRVEYEQEQTLGSQGNDQRYRLTRPEELQLEFIFDGTGVIPIKDKAGSFHKDVKEQVQNFLNVVYTMNPETHKPNFLRLIWGETKFGHKFGFDCILKDLQINYTLFAPDGKPLRAKLNATFVSYIEQDRRNREEGKQSPDVTHLRTVKEGDRLSLMSYEIYGDSSYYWQVAKVNKLVNLRRLQTNTELRFPPLEKTRT